MIFPVKMKKINLCNERYNNNYKSGMRKMKWKENLDGGKYEKRVNNYE